MATDGVKPLNMVNMTGEIIKTVLHINIAGGDKTFLIFESGNVVVLPVYRECAVQVGTIENVKTEIEGLEKQKQAIISDLDGAIEAIRGL